jgi:hypothetical protein
MTVVLLPSPCTWLLRLEPLRNVKRILIKIVSVRLKRHTTHTTNVVD